MKPAATICIPSYCRAPMAERAINSALAEAEGGQAEVLVLDDASPDGTFEILKARFRGAKHLRLVLNPRNLGLVGNWNKGLKLAHGRKIVFMGDDDTLLPGFLEASLEAHLAYPEIGFSFGAMQLQDGLGRKRFVQRALKGQSRLLESAELWSWIFYYFTPLTLCTVLFDTGKLKAAGGFHSKAWYAADGDTYLRLAARHPAYYVSQVIAGNGYHGSNLQIQMKDQRMVAALSWIIRQAPLPQALSGLKRGRLEALMRARYAATSVLLWARQGSRREAALRLKEMENQANKVAGLADSGRLRLARLSVKPLFGPAASLAMRVLHFSRRRLAWPVADPCMAKARLKDWAS